MSPVRRRYKQKLFAKNSVGILVPAQKKLPKIINIYKQDENKIDICMSLEGPNLNTLVPLYFHTFIQYNTFHNVGFHILNRSIDVKIKNYILEILNQYHIPVIFYDVPERFYQEKGPSNERHFSPEIDCSKACEYMLENCGKADLVCISHFDIGFCGNYIEYLQQNFVNNIGLIGRHMDGIMCISRKAYQQSNVGCCGISDLFAVPYKHFCESNYGFVIRRKDDPRCLTTSQQIFGFDTMQMLELYLPYNNWQMIFPSLEKYIRHYAGGSRYMDYKTISSVDYSSFNKFTNEHDFQQTMYMDILLSYGLEPIR